MELLLICPVLSPQLDESKSKTDHGFSYASKQYNDLVSRRPRYLNVFLRQGFDVLCEQCVEGMKLVAGMEYRANHEAQ